MCVNRSGRLPSRAWACLTLARQEANSITLQSRRNEPIHGARPPGRGVLRDWLKIADELQADLFPSEDDYRATLVARDEAALREAAAQGNPRAMYSLALHLLTQDQREAHAEAENWLRKAAIRGDTNASV